MKKRIDLTGRQFGDLTVLGKAETKQKGRFWNAKCVCGNELVVKQSDLKNQVVTNCGHEEETAVKEVKKAAPKKAKAPAKKSSKGTGHVGVSKVELKSGTRYKANISVEGKNKHLGTFDTLEEAVAARQEAEEQYRQ
ncbi:hypothetical protein [Jeotgalibaca porci]|uniref:hypothetical protein n=1 Tax=Jeotgalibaca porci TaxID=1868793 RepID=UPI00359FC610